jgi:hypothetical protein
MGKYPKCVMMIIRSKSLMDKGFINIYPTT